MVQFFLYLGYLIKKLDLEFFQIDVYNLLTCYLKIRPYLMQTKQMIIKGIKT